MVTLLCLPACVPPPGSYRRRPPGLLHAPGGVCNNFRPFRVTHPIPDILLTPFDLPPSSQRSRGSDRKKEGEVSDPPFFVPRTSRQALPCNTSCNTSLPVGGVAHFSVTTPIFIPAGRLR